MIKQPRVNKGLQAQESIHQYLESYYGNDFEFIEAAKASKKSGDLIANIHGIKTQVEIKRRDTKSSPIKLYEKLIARGQPDAILDEYARLTSSDKCGTFTELIDLVRQDNTAVGFPGDSGVNTKSGKCYMTTDCCYTKESIHNTLLTLLSKQQDDLFAVWTHKCQTADIYDLNSQNLYTTYPALPKFDKIVVKTYGGSYKSSMRIAIKVVLAR